MLELALLFALRFLGLLGLETKLFLQVQRRFKATFIVAMVEDAFFLASFGLMARLMIDPATAPTAGIVALSSYGLALYLAWKLTNGR